MSVDRQRHIATISHIFLLMRIEGHIEPLHQLQDLSEVELPLHHVHGRLMTSCLFSHRLRHKYQFQH